MANLDETKSAPVAKEMAHMNLSVLGSVGGVGVEICEPRATKMKQQQLTITFLIFQMANLDETKRTPAVKETA